MWEDGNGERRTGRWVVCGMVESTHMDISGFIASRCLTQIQFLIVGIYRRLDICLCAEGSLIGRLATPTSIREMSSLQRLSLRGHVWDISKVVSKMQSYPTLITKSFQGFEIKGVSLMAAVCCYIVLVRWDNGRHCS